MNIGGNRSGAASNVMRYGWPYLIVLLISFLVGTLLGVAFAFFLEPSAELSGYLHEYCQSLSQEMLRVSFFSVLWDCIRWPLLVAVLGITAVGIVGIPVLFVARGFLLSFSITTFGLLLGMRGIAVSTALFAVCVLFVLPVLFILGSNGLRAAYMRLPNAMPIAGKQYQLEIWLICAGILAVSTAVQWTATPAILAAVCSHMAF